MGTSILSKLDTAVAVLREAWRLPRAPGNDEIFRHLRSVADRAMGRPRGLKAYLDDHPALGRVSVKRDWFHDHASGESRLIYSNALFADGCLRYKLGRRRDAAIVFLPGNTTGAEQVFTRGAHPASMTRVAESLGMGLACWDWPLQGERRDGCLYRGLQSTYSAEREYSRILPALGSCLWREAIAELAFALEQLKQYIGDRAKICVVGWSMGACFAYAAPLLTSGIRATVAAGSCARVKDLLSEGKTRVHGYFFYPLNGLPYFDLDDLVAEVLEANHRLGIVFGGNDPGCLAATAKSLELRASQLHRPLRITVIPGLGHELSVPVSRYIVNFLSRA